VVSEVPLIDRALGLFHSLLPQHEPWRALSREAVLICIFATVIVVLEGLSSGDLTRYRSRQFLNDLAYSFFYQGGIYNLLIYVPVFSTLQQRLTWADLHVLSALPPVAAFVAYWLIADFLGYWLHRLQHATPFLWAFHSVHHAPTRITFLTSNRNHLVDQFMANIIMFVPILVLGVPRTIWLPFVVAQTMLEALQHAELSWRYGHLYRVIVSPLFHNLHHSTAASEYNGNYAKILALWDFVFGTAVDRDRLPAAYGIDGIEIPERLTAQFAAPFRLLSRRDEGAVSVAETPAIQG
jgi:sterol desaturase/sphingolipid hydroxylase (fatty acid hydroxylase superfamily)